MSKAAHTWTTDEGLLRWYPDGHFTISDPATGKLVARANPTEQFTGKRSNKSTDAEVERWLEAFDLDPENPVHRQDCLNAINLGVAGMKAFRQAHGGGDKGAEYAIETDEDGRLVRLLINKGENEGAVFLYDTQSTRDIGLQDGLWRDALLYRLHQAGGDVEKMSQFDRALHKELVVKNARLSVDVLARSLFKADSA